MKIWYFQLVIDVKNTFRSFFLPVLYRIFSKDVNQFLFRWICIGEAVNIIDDHGGCNEVVFGIIEGTFISQGFINNGTYTFSHAGSNGGAEYMYFIYWQLRHEGNTYTA